MRFINKDRTEAYEGLLSFLSHSPHSNDCASKTCHPAISNCKEKEPLPRANNYFCSRLDPKAKRRIQLVSCDISAAKDEDSVPVLERNKLN